MDFFGSIFFWSKNKWWLYQALTLRRKNIFIRDFFWKISTHAENSISEVFQRFGVIWREVVKDFDTIFDFEFQNMWKNENNLYYDPNRHCNFAKNQYISFRFFLNHIYSIWKHHFRGFPAIFDHLDLLFRSARSLGNWITGIPLSHVNLSKTQ